MKNEEKICGQTCKCIDNSECAFTAERQYLTPAQRERLAILIEECAEVQQIACKILRHGYNSRNPTVNDSPNNKQLLETEVGDLLFAIEWLSLKDIDPTKVRYAAIDKKGKIKKYLHHN